MARVLKILIVDPDQFFVSGLQQAVKAHFHAKGIPVIFMNQPLSYAMADLIFWAPGFTTTVMPKGLLAGQSHKYHLIMLMSQHKTHQVTNNVPWVFYRHQSPGKLYSLIDQVTNIPTSDNIGSIKNMDIIKPLTSLSPRQMEVMSYVSKGMCPKKISENLNINKKTVSCHKRTAMRKLQLNRLTDLHHWLLCNFTANKLE
jgi:DNA-binding CsgD family transcriptional regulator